MNARALHLIVIGCSMCLVIPLWACSTPQPTVVKKVEAPAKSDPYTLFSGKRLTGEGPFRVQAEPMAIEKARLIVEVMKIRITEMENPDGGTEKDVSLRLRFQHGEESKVLWLEDGESTRLFGREIRLSKGGESYVDHRQDYYPFALLEVN